MRVHSAGTLPSDWIDPVALRLLDELDLSPDQEFPKPLTREVIRAADVVITLECWTPSGRIQLEALWAMCGPAEALSLHCGPFQQVIGPRGSGTGTVLKTVVARVTVGSNPTPTALQVRSLQVRWGATFRSGTPSA